MRRMPSLTRIAPSLSARSKDVEITGTAPTGVSTAPVIHVWSIIASMSSGCQLFCGREHVHTCTYE